MRPILRILLPVLAVLHVGLAPAAGDDDLLRWMDGPQRSEKNRQRDGARQPAGTLAFFGLRADQTVVEIWPSVGVWWFEILAPYLRDRGQYVAALHAGAHNPAAARAEHEVVERRMTGSPALYGKVKVAHSPGLTEAVPPDSVDLLLTFSNLHNWMVDGNVEEVVREFHAVLKPGGVLGVVDHRGREDLSREAQLKSGYLREDEIVALIEALGFRLVARGEMAANPRDTRDYPEGVWTLPPTLRMKDVDREKYLAIGESDKFTLKFVKIVAPR